MLRTELEDQLSELGFVLKEEMIAVLDQYNFEALWCVFSALGERCCWL